MYAFTDNDKNPKLGFIFHNVNHVILVTVIHYHLVNYPLSRCFNLPTLSATLIHSRTLDIYTTYDRFGTVPIHKQ